MLATGPAPWGAESKWEQLGRPTDDCGRLAGRKLDMGTHRGGERKVSLARSIDLKRRNYMRIGRLPRKALTRGVSQVSGRRPMKYERRLEPAASSLTGSIVVKSLAKFTSIRQLGLGAGRRSGSRLLLELLEIGPETASRLANSTNPLPRAEPSGAFYELPKFAKVCSRPGLRWFGDRDEGSSSSSSPK